MSIETMAVGVPVILPEVYRPLFGDAALYATPETAVELARKLHADAAAYDAHVKHAQDYVRQKFSFEMHLDRVRAVKEMKVNAGREAELSKADTATELKAEAKENAVPNAVPAAPAIPEKAGKMSGNLMKDIETVDLSTGSRPPIAESVLLKCTFAGHRFDYLWRPKPNSKRLFVLFSGDAQRGRNEPPVFQRWSWAEHFPGHCLYVSDPMLHMAPDIGLAWYAGTDTLDPMEVIVRRIRAMLPLVGLTENDVTAYGSSGGGFAALRMTTQMPGASAISINPQINIADFERRSPDRYARTCLNREDRFAALADFPERMDLKTHVAKLKQRQLILIQNRLDVHHYEEHYMPFCKSMGASSHENLTHGKFRRILFDHEGGHGKAETPEVFATALQILQSGFKTQKRVRA